MTAGALRVGLLVPLEGEGDWIGRQCVDAARGALELASERGRSRRPVELIPIHARHPRGDAYDTDLVAAEAERVVALADREGCAVVSGTIASSQALRTIPLAQRRGLLYWEAIAAADELTSRDRPLVFRIDTTARAYGAAAVRFLAERLAPAWAVKPKALRLGICEMEESFCAAMAGAVRDEAAARGISVVARTTFRLNDPDLTSPVRALRDASPDTVVMIGFGPNVPNFWRTARAERLEPRALIGNGAWALEHRVRQLGSDLEGIYLVDTPHVSSMSDRALAADAREQLAWWKARCVAEPHSTKTAVDRDLVFLATYALATEVASRASEMEPSALARAARALDVPLGGTILGYGIRFDAKGDNERAFAAVFQWQDGQRHIVDPEVVATAAPRLAPLPRWADRPVAVPA